LLSENQVPTSYHEFLTSCLMALQQLLGDTLQTKDGVKNTSDVLADCDAVGLYFSAHWCGPCRHFTPALADAYKKMKANGKKFEVVFVSSDRTEDEFKSYYEEHPWNALPYSDRDKKSSLSKKYKVRGIPTLVIVDGKTGETITTDGRTALMEDTNGVKFPWRPPTFWEALGQEFMKSDGDTVEVDEVRKPGVLGLYFSAHWCGPCRSFTPTLIEKYKSIKEAGHPFEIIFVSSDKSMQEFQEYFGTMPWLAIPQGDSRKKELSTLFDVEGIPTFVLVDSETGKVINANGRGAITDPRAEFPWHPKAVNDLSSPEGINEEVSLCVMMEGCTGDVQSSVDAILTTYAKASKAAGDDMLFFTACSSTGAVPQVRKLTELGEAAAMPQLVLLDIPSEGGYYVNPPGEVTAESVKSFVASYRAGELKRQQM